MGSFYQHIRCSTATGVVYGGAAYACGVPVPTAILAGGMCSAAGMLPDIDSDTSQSFRECIYFAAGVAAVTATMRANEVLVDSDVVALVGASVFFFVRFVVGVMIRRFTVHRGMFHSIPAAIIAGEIVFLASAGSVEMRLVKAGGLIAGFLSHLILDEIFSVDLRGMRIKKSFGTALKFGNPQNKQLTSMVYTVMIALGVACLNEPQLREMLPTSPEGQNSWEGIQQIAQKAQEDFQKAIPESLHPLVNNFRAEIEQAIPEPVRAVVASSAPRVTSPALAPAPPPTYVTPIDATPLATLAPPPLPQTLPPTLEPSFAPVISLDTALDTALPVSEPSSPSLFPKRQRGPAVLR
ncbi:MAG: metal-dependent hydrolase [Thermoguttaceae bacterium]